METRVVMHELQLGFTSDGVCEKSLFILKSVVKYFNVYGSNVYVTKLDPSKAYDKANHCKLIIEMFDASISCDFVLNVLLLV